MLAAKASRCIVSSFVELQTGIVSCFKMANGALHNWLDCWFTVSNLIQDDQYINHRLLGIEVLCMSFVSSCCLQSLTLMHPPLSHSLLHIHFRAFLQVFAIPGSGLARTIKTTRYIINRLTLSPSTSLLRDKSRQISMFMSVLDAQVRKFHNNHRFVVLLWSNDVHLLLWSYFFLLKCAHQLKHYDSSNICVVQRFFITLALSCCWAMQSQPSSNGSCG